jgi:hypothetical protein
MIWQSGDRVLLFHTGSLGTVIRLTADGMALVRLDGDRDAIPVPLDALREPGAQASIVQKVGKLPPPPMEGRYEGWETGHIIAIAVDPETTEHRSFYLLLINAGPDPLPYAGRFAHVATTDLRLEGELPPRSWRQLAEGAMDKLNDAPELLLQRWRKDGLRQTALPEFRQRIKARSVITRLERQEGFPFRAVFYPLPDTQTSPPVIPVKTRSSGPPSVGRRSSGVPDPADRATFETILDLHIEKLVPDHRKLSEAEIFQAQMMTFDGYLERAIRLGVPRVFVIHGLGKGKLRDTILDRCSRNSLVLRASNDYHPLFGFGATEIILTEESEG